ncbi:DUF2975 domain-containing protein [Listeria kieliensis]|uniref:DUF2975 domain-containing protein n=1 Tax=Listeria kieliensis TaxID=1621700 RepID=A0A3D8TQ63_9LIST|nr:DUF2975 domain-containing protein [Listeria kieliensis]RDX00744.1 hypothetical protein UR08_07100 [Listeria kieliensis]
MRQQQKSQKLANILSVLLKISAIVCGTLTFFIILFQPTNITTTTQEKQFNGTSFQITFQSQLDNGVNHTTAQMWIFTLVLLFSAVLIIAILWLASQIFQGLAVQFSPFQEKYVRKLRQISILLFLYALAPQLLYSLLSTLFLPGYLFNFGIDIAILFAAVFYLLTEVFRYGVKLQTESDETL